MPLNIKNDEAHLLAHRLAEKTGTSLTEAVTRALRDALSRADERNRRDIQRLVEDLDSIALSCAALEVIDNRSSDALLGYDEHGMPH